MNNVVQGGNTTIIGNDNNVAGENSLAMGSKVRIPAIAGDSFARNDGASEFQLQKSHLFAVKAENGVVVGKNVPDANTALTISGDLRIGVDAAKNGLITNTSSNKGVIKSVLTT
ncbi:MAG: hypothetical protein LBD11_01235 [Candidatus Peribacteria bacterium]|nr:hypothetical protein [Candidatus Peribacteria bacterium]